MEMSPPADIDAPEFKVKAPVVERSVTAPFEVTGVSTVTPDCAVKAKAPVKLSGRSMSKAPVAPRVQLAPVRFAFKVALPATPNVAFKSVVRAL